MKAIVLLAGLSLSLALGMSPSALAQLDLNSAGLKAPTPLPAASSAAQKLYAAAQKDLLQLRVLLKNGRSQASVGSGFLIGTSNLVITNFHVVSQIALEPDV